MASSRLPCLREGDSHLLGTGRSGRWGASKQGGKISSTGSSSVHGLCRVGSSSRMPPSPVGTHEEALSSFSCMNNMAYSVAILSLFEVFVHK